MYLSKSKYCVAVQCLKELWLSTYKPDIPISENNESVLDNGTRVGELARNLFGKHVTIPFEDNLQKMVDITNAAIRGKDSVICEASFLFNDCFCSVDILRKIGDSYEIYEVKSSTEIKDIYLDDLAYQYYVLSSLGLKVSSASIVYINKDYVRNGDLDLQELFIIADFTNDVQNKKNEVERYIGIINKYMKQDKEPADDIGIYCSKPYECPYFEYCTKHLVKPNVFDLKGQGLSFKKKIDLYSNGICSYEKLLDANIPDKFKEQIRFELYNLDEKFVKEEIEAFLQSLSYPLYFLDFETYQQSIPEFDGVKPYMQIPFQFSLHYINEPSGELFHKDFLADGINDPRRSLAESLVSSIPEDVCVLAYNMGFEKGRIKELADLYPDLRSHLLCIMNNINDLMIPFQKRYYYHKNLHGSCSIKYVLPTLFPDDPSLNYANLEMVHKGNEAMDAYANLHNLSEEDAQKLRYHMLKYCELDTYAMVKIWEELNKKCKIKVKNN